MIEKKIYCECCGKEFYSEFGETGGYNDHVRSFLGNSHLAGKDMKKDIKEILFKGNTLRKSYDIKERLKCYELWDIDSTFKRNVIWYCLTYCDEIDAAERKFNDFVNSLTETEELVFERRIKTWRR